MMKQIEEMTKSQMKMAEEMAAKMSACSREMAEAMMENARRLSEVMSGSVFSPDEHWINDVPGVIRKEDPKKDSVLPDTSELVRVRHRLNMMRGLMETARGLLETVLNCIESGEHVPLDWYDATREVIETIDRG